MKARVYLAVPAYNEEATIQSLMKRVQSLVNSYDLDLTFVVANDGSKDRTLEMTRNFQCTYKKEIIDIQPNQGLANAMSTLFQFAFNTMQPDDILVTMDADDSHNPLLIPRMIQQIQEGSNIVIASRYQAGAEIFGLSKFRKITAVGASMMFRLFAPIPRVKDYTCGFRAFEGELILRAKERYGNRFIEEKGFSCTAETLLKLAKLQPIVHEVPMILRYDRKAGPSKMPVMKTIKLTLALLRKYRTY
jgi:dolichol-phosphate mannosyltransferase